MPDFDARFAAGTSLAVWHDHESTRPSRINPAQARPLRYVKATVGVPVEVHAWLGDADAPADDDLGGRLFSSDFAEHPTPAPPATTSPAGQSSVQRFTPGAAGHYLWILRRADGGALGLHLDAEA